MYCQCKDCKGVAKHLMGTRLEIKVEVCDEHRDEIKNIMVSYRERIAELEAEITTKMFHLNKK